ncbi:hypothetical protein A4G19_06165 [Pasteurellaceae bacterium Macca]|nr:hypothetical protein [Pasteurellaceae bacterium Macca]
MKLAKIALTLGAFLVSASALAGSISSSSNISVLAFDGHKVKKNATLQINDNAKHQVVVEVSSIYQSGSDSAYFESSPIIVTFEGSQEDIKILAPELRQSSAVEKFKQSPTFTLQTASGKTLDYQWDYLKGEGFMPNANIVDNLSRYNASEGKAAVKTLAAMPMVMTIPTSAGKATKGKVMVQGENIAEQQLQYWFQQADKETQKRFLDWAKKQ